jgi:hypothetical protein
MSLNQSNPALSVDLIEMGKHLSHVPDKSIKNMHESIILCEYTVKFYLDQINIDFTFFVDLSLISFEIFAADSLFLAIMTNPEVTLSKSHKKYIK